jgi:hypothetical protein
MKFKAKRFKELRLPGTKGGYHVGNLNSPPPNYPVLSLTVECLKFGGLGVGGEEFFLDYTTATKSKQKDMLLQFSTCLICDNSNPPCNLAEFLHEGPLLETSPQITL